MSVMPLVTVSVARKFGREVALVLVAASALTAQSPAQFCFERRLVWDWGRKAAPAPPPSKPDTSAVTVIAPDHLAVLTSHFWGSRNMNIRIGFTDGSPKLRLFRGIRG